jgi:hypothetical protein
MTSSFFTGKIVRQDTIDLGTEKSKLHPVGQFRESHDSIQHFLLAFLRDQLLELRDYAWVAANISSGFRNPNVSFSKKGPLFRAAPFVPTGKAG